MAIGRPFKYRAIIEGLDDDTLYTPSAVALRAFINGKVRSQKARVRLRNALSSMARYHGFPAEGDGLVKRVGQPPRRGWYGWRFKAVLKKGSPAKASSAKKKKQKRSRSSLGLPEKYCPAISALEDDGVYNGASIARLAIEKSILPPEFQQRLRLALNRFIKKAGFPPEGDALVALPGQGRVPGWRGSRFKQAIEAEGLSQ